MAFEVNIHTEKNMTIFNFVGVLDEHAVLPKELPQDKEIHFNLENLSYINSVGVRSWIKWVAEASKNRTLFLIRCPALLVKNFSSIRGMLNKNTIVQSFYVPYYDEIEHERKNILFVREKHFMNDGVLNMPVLKNSAGKIMEPDVIEQTYFSFLKL